MDFNELDKVKFLSKFDEALSRGLCVGKGTREGQMCIEAAICYALDLPHSDDPKCVTRLVRDFKMRLNDSGHWKSPHSRAEHLRALGIAQVGSAGVVDSKEFSKQIAKKTIQVLIPKLFRELYPHKFIELVNECERKGTSVAARALAKAAADAAAYAAAYAAADATAYAAAYAAADATAYAAVYAAANAAANAAATAAANAANAADAASHAACAAAGEKYLILAAQLALETLKELKSPGCAWL
mgnify:CR=1 FL=1